MYEKKYADYGPTLAAECLSGGGWLGGAGRDVAAWLLSAGLWREAASDDGPIGGVDRGRSILASWCRWTVRITTGSRVGAAGRC